MVSAHPDDDTLFAGGTLAMYAQKGNDVYILKSFGGRWSDGSRLWSVQQEGLKAMRQVLSEASKLI